MPPRGWRKSKDEKPSWLEAPKWNEKFKAFGDRVNFLSEESQHLATGKLRILPPRNPEKRERSS